MRKKHAEEQAALHGAYKVQCSAFITACDPLSEHCDASPTSHPICCACSIAMAPPAEPLRLIPDNWSADQALTVVELLDDLRERICTHYQLALHELQREQRVPPVNAHLNDIDDPF
ncbi:hypothetical protein [Paraburkholderia elongata]|nr:hypothetical protein [Paraburkholderia elongata]